MKRRNFIGISAAGITALSIPSVYYYLKKVEYDPLLARPQALSLIWDDPMIKSVGNLYRLKSEEDERTLVGLLMDDNGADNLEHSLQKKIEGDFKTGKTVLVDGWILSVTEARQCALFSTIQKR